MSSYFPKTLGVVRILRTVILLDKSNNWIEKYLLEYLPHPQAFVQISYEADQVSNADIVFVIGYTKILASTISARNGHVFVIHESDLPSGKGFSPVQWQILAGSNTIIVSVIQLDALIDGGDIVLQKKLEFVGDELYEEIRAKQAAVTFDLVCECIECYPDYSPKPQVGSENFYRRRYPEDSELDPDKTLRELFPLLRVCNNEKWPAFFVLEGKKFILKISKEK